MKTILFLLLFMASVSQAKNAYVPPPEKWKCTEDSSERQDNVWLLCASGEGDKQLWAMYRALANAVTEFNLLCKESSDCKDQKRTMEPMRATCQNDGVSWKCWRLLKVTVY